MDCVIHVGLHKTATTSFQHFLFNEERFLSKLGIIYPNSVIDVHSKQHLLIPGCFFEKHPSLKNNRDRNLKNYIEKLNSEIKNSEMELCLLSSEVFNELNDIRPDDTRKIIQCLKSIFNNVFIFISTRDPLERALSMYKHKIRRANVVENFRKEYFDAPRLFLNKVNGYTKSINKWKEIDCKVIKKDISDHEFPIQGFLEEIITLMQVNKKDLLKKIVKEEIDFFKNKNLIVNKNNYESVSYLFTCIVGLIFKNSELELKDKLCFGKVNSFINDLDEVYRNILFKVTDYNLIRFLKLDFGTRFDERNLNDYFLKSKLDYQSSFILKKLIYKFIEKLIIE